MTTISSSYVRNLMEYIDELHTAADTYESAVDSGFNPSGEEIDNLRAAVAGIGQEDDDGNSAVNGGQQQAPKTSKPVDVDKAVAAIRGANDADTINKYVNSCRSRGASKLQMQSIQAAATERLGEMEVPA